MQMKADKWDIPKISEAATIPSAEGERDGGIMKV